MLYLITYTIMIRYGFPFHCLGLPVDLALGKPRSVWSEGSTAVASYENTYLEYICKKCREVAVYLSSIAQHAENVRHGNPSFHELLVKEYGAFSQNGEKLFFKKWLFSGSAAQACNPTTWKQKQNGQGIKTIIAICQD